MNHSTLDSPIGKLYLSCSEAGLQSIHYTKPSGFKKSPTDTPLMKRAKRQLLEYFKGERQSWDIPLDWGNSNGFYDKVRKACAKIDYGKTVSYKELASLAKNPKAARAVGTAMATNPLSIVVPCHRVVRSDGELGNYGGGVSAKKWLLQLESAA